MTEIENYTREEFENHLLEVYGSDFAGLAARMAEINVWLTGNTVSRQVVEYVNAELNPNSYFDRRFILIPSNESPRPEIGDSQGTSRRYRLVGTYAEENGPLDLAGVLGRVKVVRPAVVLVDAGPNEKGASRRAFAIYDKGELYRVIEDNPFSEHLWADYNLSGAKEWASGAVSITGEVWESLWDKTKWPFDAPKFSDFIAQELYMATLDSGQDEEVSHEGWGTSAYLFKADLAILYCGSRGEVSYEKFEDEEVLQAMWNELVERYYPDDEDEDEEN